MTVDLDTESLKLSWSDVDPERTNPPDRARAVAVAIDALMETPRDGAAYEWHRAAESAIALKFAREWGPWTNGWCYPTSEDGGVVKTWAHYGQEGVMPKGADDLEPTAERAADALLEWRAWLVRLSVLFKKIDVVGQADVSDSALASAAARIVDVVVEETGAEDAWYRTCRQVLGWFLEHQGVAPHRIDVLVRTAIAGRFRSWIAPDDALRTDVVRRIGAGAAAELKGGDS